MQQHIASELFHSGCFILVLNAPLESEFGIDCNMFTTGPKFKGLKFVPPGMHYISLQQASSNSFKQGVFVFMEEKQILVFKWNPSEESLELESDSEQVDRIRANLKELDPFLGPYPLFNSSQTDLSPEYKKWQRLTSSIRKPLLDRMIPSAFVSSMSSVSRFSDMEQILPHSKEKVNKSSTIQDPFRIHFTEIDMKRSWPPGATGQTITKYSLDKSYLLVTVLEHMATSESQKHRRSQQEIYKDFLGEFQLAFVLFLIGQVYDGFEQWKLFVQLMCQSHEAMWNLHPIPGNTIIPLSSLFVSFMETFSFQLQECPDDFFQDALSSNSFLRGCLVSLADATRSPPTSPLKEEPKQSHPPPAPLQEPSSSSSISSSSTSWTPLVSPPTPQLNKDLERTLTHLFDFVSEQFHWDPRLSLVELDAEDEEGEDAPVVVEL